jgi:hypothetical protein
MDALQTRWATMRNRLRELLVLHGAKPEALDLNLVKLANFAGVSARRSALESASRQITGPLDRFRTTGIGHHDQ